jgi:hypothetical protein
MHWLVEKASFQRVGTLCRLYLIKLFGNDLSTVA